MRNLVIDRIRNSPFWCSCIDNGMEDEMPNLDVMPDTILLELYLFYCT